ncbi:MAG: hypothetical protein WDN72_03055 [Alphaproteobacteria bacterium]
MAQDKIPVNGSQKIDVFNPDGKETVITDDKFVGVTHTGQKINVENIHVTISSAPDTNGDRRILQNVGTEKEDGEITQVTTLERTIRPFGQGKAQLTPAQIAQAQVLEKKVHAALVGSETDTKAVSEVVSQANNVARTVPKWHDSEIKR